MGSAVGRFRGRIEYGRDTSAGELMIRDGNHPAAIRANQSAVRAEAPRAHRWSLMMSSKVWSAMAGPSADEILTERSTGR